MKGCEFSLDDFTYLVKLVSLHHAKQIAGWVGFTAHTRKGVIYFRKLLLRFRDRLIMITRCDQYPNPDQHAAC